MLKDVDEFYPVHKKDLYFMVANVYFLKGDYKRAKELYRQVLKMGPNAKLES